MSGVGWGAISLTRGEVKRNKKRVTSPDPGLLLLGSWNKCLKKRS